MILHPHFVTFPPRQHGAPLNNLKNLVSLFTSFANHEMKLLNTNTCVLQCCCTSSTNPKQHDLQGKSVTVIGLGKSGRAAVNLALARGASVLAFDQSVKLQPLEAGRKLIFELAFDQSVKLCPSEVPIMYIQLIYTVLSSYLGRSKVELAFDHIVKLRPLEKDPCFGEEGRLRTVCGQFEREIVEDADIVVVSPGVPLKSYGLSSLLQSGKKIMSELDFAAQTIPKSIKMLAVTGTNGKSTVTTFAGQMLSHLGITAFVGGNIGTPLSEIALQYFTNPLVKPNFQVGVVEVSSYQMEIPSEYFRPSVAVVLNLTPDHLERHGTMSNYAATKCRLFSHMANNKLGVLAFGNKHLMKAIRDHMNDFSPAWIGAFPGIKVDVEAKTASLEVPGTGVTSRLRLDALTAKGTHNYTNAAVAAFSVLGLDVRADIEGVQAAIGKLKAPPHRMQIVYEDIHGVTWVDDSKATNIEATLAGLMGLKGQKSVILLGGLAKVLNGQESYGFEQLIEPLKYHKCVITFGSSGASIHKTLTDNGLSIPCIRAGNLEDAVQCARTIAKAGDSIILTPGCASFDEFRNFEHRGMFFQELARSLPPTCLH
ncbi:hypothetical protein ACFE04_030535 [Oxalis oulophora]